MLKNMFLFKKNVTRKNIHPDMNFLFLYVLKKLFYF